MFQHGQLLQEVSLQNSELWVGRDDSCKIKLDDRSISRKHALFRSSKKGDLEFEKISEVGWVKLNGENSSQSKLKDGDRLEFGSYEIRVSSDSAPAPVGVKPIELKPVEIKPVEFAPEAEESPTPEFQVEVNSAVEENHFNVNESVPAFEMPAEPVNEFEESSNDGATKVFSVSSSVKPILNFGKGNQFEVVDAEISIGIVIFLIFFSKRR